MKLAAFIFLFIIALPTLADISEHKTQPCVGVIEKSDGSTTYPSPFNENIECYPDLRVPDSRFAAVLALRAFLEELGHKVTVSPLPILHQLKADGPFRPAWEVYIYSTDSQKALMLYIVDAEAGVAQKICDNRNEEEHCRNLGKE